MTCRIVFLQVGNADCTLVRTPDACAIVDLPKQRQLNDCLKRHEICSIDRVFVTHDHRDHFLGLERLVNWLEAWVRGEEPAVALHFPDGLWQRAQEKLKELKGEGQVDNRKYQRLQSTMDKISLWSQEGHVKYSPLSADHDIPAYGVLSFKVLHPSWLEVETQRATQRAAHNEGSLGGGGLPTTRPCAGEIIVEAETDGRWSWPGEEGHRETVKSVPLAACLNTHEK